MRFPDQQGERSSPVPCPAHAHRIHGSRARADPQIYSHPSDATASGLARRTLNERLHLAEQQASYSAYCPVGKQACALENDPTSYECLDTDSELESCGGCMWGLYTGNGNMTLPTSKAIE